MTATLETPGRIRPPLQPTLWEAMVVDNFAGGGGASLGLEWGTGRIVDVAINHDPAAIRMHTANHPHTRHLQDSVFAVDPREVCGGRPVAAAWFSPDCTHFSRAKGSKPLKKAIRGLAWVVLRWAGTVRPERIFLENVPEFLTWGPLNRNRRPIRSRRGETFQRWLWQLAELGYDVEHRVLDAKFYGTAVGANLDAPLHTVTGGGQKYGLVAAFLIKYYGCGIGQNVGEPMHTVVSKDRYGLVTVQIDGETWALADIGLRMLTPRELARAQGFPDDYVLTGTKSQQVARIGNSVPPPVAAAIVRANMDAGELDHAAA